MLLVGGRASSQHGMKSEQGSGKCKAVYSVVAGRGGRGVD